MGLQGAKIEPIQIVSQDDDTRELHKSYGRQSEQSSETDAENICAF